MRVTTKGQVTIPKNIREHLGIGPGSEIDFIERASGAVEVVGSWDPEQRRAALKRHLDDWFARVEGSGDAGLSAEEIMSMTRGPERGDHG